MVFSSYEKFEQAAHWMKLANSSLALAISSDKMNAEEAKMENPMNNFQSPHFVTSPTAALPNGQTWYPECGY
jgi:hypothetical protein